MDKFAIITSGRSGSHLITQSLYEAGLSVEPELFCPARFKDFDSINKLDVLMPNQARLHKFLYWQMEELDVFIYILNNFRLLHLTRNIIETYVSYRLAEQTNIWHSLEKPDYNHKLKIDLSNFADYLIYTNNKKNTYKGICEKEYSFKEVTQNWDVFIHEFVEYIGFPKVPIVKLFVKNFDSTKDRIENLEEASQLCLDLGFQQEWKECS